MRIHGENFNYYPILETLKTLVAVVRNVDLTPRDRYKSRKYFQKGTTTVTDTLIGYQRLHKRKNTLTRTHQIQPMPSGKKASIIDVVINQSSHNIATKTNTINKV